MDARSTSRYVIIDHRDPDYPCKCPCHANPCVMHFVACCRDNGYVGLGLVGDDGRPTSLSGRAHYPIESIVPEDKYGNYQFVHRLCPEETIAIVSFGPNETVTIRRERKDQVVLFSDLVQLIHSRAKW